MERPYNISRIPTEGTYFQRLPKELHTLISLYDYDCNFDVTFDKTGGRFNMRLRIRFKNIPYTVTFRARNYGGVSLESSPHGQDLYSNIAVDRKRIVETLLKEVEKGNDVVFYIGTNREIAFNNVGTSSPHIFNIQATGGEMSLNNIPLCRQLIEVLLKMYPPG